MEALSTKQLVSYALIAGASLGATVFGAYVARSVIVISRGHRWQQAQSIGVIRTPLNRRIVLNA